ncbi:LamB/YcsF family protein, partial [Saccharomonospora azurea]|uniref:LamB/YcsF family protein n=1 Tax=Saccharomonospora azurea TaxID=40988 RepID=UPI002409442C
GTLVSRREASAVVLDPDVVVERSVRMAVEGAVQAVDGSVLKLSPQSLCVHGDTLGAVEIARRVRKALADAGVAVKPFV